MQPEQCHIGETLRSVSPPQLTSALASTSTSLTGTTTQKTHGARSFTFSSSEVKTILHFYLIDLLKKRF